MSTCTHIHDTQEVLAATAADFLPHVTEIHIMYIATCDMVNRAHAYTQVDRAVSLPLHVLLVKGSLATQLGRSVSLPSSSSEKRDRLVIAELVQRRLDTAYTVFQSTGLRECMGKVVLFSAQFHQGASNRIWRNSWTLW